MKRDMEMTRRQWQKIRQMDHMQLALWMKSVYASGYEDGKKDAEGLNREQVRETLMQVKGIGGKRADEIMQALEARIATAQK